MKRQKVLITCGPTWVPIDKVRVISNTSSGQLGQLLAKDLNKIGAQVTLIEGQVESPLRSNRIRVIKFAFFDELERILKQELKKKYDVVIHAAAVSDYKVQDSSRSKIQSGLKQLKLLLGPTKKLINQVKKANKKVFLVGFKLEPNFKGQLIRSKTKSLFDDALCDVVVANSLKESDYRASIIDRDFRLLAKAKTRAQASHKLIQVLKKR